MLANEANNEEKEAMAQVEKVREADEIWRCGVCGNVVKVVEVGGGQLVCCGRPMIRADKKATEKENQHG